MVVKEIFIELRKNRHSVYKLTYHIVLVTKYRHKCITNDIFNAVKRKVESVIENWNGSIIEINHDKDHIHMLAELPPQIAISNAVCSIKTVTSRLVKKEFKEYIEKFYWKESFWSNSYLALSVGGATLDVVKKYIEEQGL